MKTIVTIFSEDFNEREFRCKLSNKYIDIIEFRCENLIKTPSEIIKRLTLLKEFGKEIILTLRSLEEGGRCKFTKKDYISCILKVSSSNLCNFIDLEIDFLTKNDILDIKRSINQKIILSCHKVSGLISKKNIEEYIEIADFFQPEILKIVDRPNDYFDLVSRMKEISKFNRPYQILSICMGEIGRISRVKNSYYTPEYSFLSFKKESLIGQFSVDKAKLIKNSRPYFSSVFRSVIGPIQIIADEINILEVSIGKIKKLDLGLSTTTPQVLEARRQILEYLRGDRKEFNLPYKLGDNLSVLEENIYKKVLGLAYGTTRTYEDIGLSVASKNLARIVGNTMKKNKLLLLVPCHRVVSKNKGVGKYKAGEKIKQYLLDMERRHS